MLETIWIISLIACIIEVLIGDKILNSRYSYEDTNILLMIPPMSLVVFSMAIILNYLHL